jgi:hypothetical protein
MERSRHHSASLNDFKPTSTGKRCPKDQTAPSNPFGIEGYRSKILLPLPSYIRWKGRLQATVEECNS